MEKTRKASKKSQAEERYPVPTWVNKGVVEEEDLCPDCFRVVGVKSRYALVCFLGKQKQGATVGTITDFLNLRQPTVTHHLNILKSVDAVECEQKGRERVYTLNRQAHCFEDCKIPY